MQKFKFILKNFIAALHTQENGAVDWHVGALRDETAYPTTMLAGVLVFSRAVLHEANREQLQHKKVKSSIVLQLSNSTRSRLIK